LCHVWQVLDTVAKWCVGRVIEINEKKGEALIHFEVSCAFAAQRNNIIFILKTVWLTCNPSIACRGGGGVGVGLERQME
jgi:hypothetical protein